MKHPGRAVSGAALYLGGLAVVAWCPIELLVLGGVMVVAGTILGILAI